MTSLDNTNCPQEAITGPLVVSPRQACEMLCVSLTRLYELLHSGELETYRHGRSRRITISSIRSYIARQVEVSPYTWGPPP
jgi:excisionase family DNA binding protein